jgi:hypothetical protein
MAYCASSTGTGGQGHVGHICACALLLMSMLLQQSSNINAKSIAFVNRFFFIFVWVFSYLHPAAGFGLSSFIDMKPGSVGGCEYNNSKQAPRWRRGIN